MRLHRTTRIGLGIVLFCFGFVFIVSVALVPRPVHAQLAVAETGGGFFGAKEVKLTVFQSIWSSAIVGLVNAATIFAQQFAYDLAVGLASGFKGQNPFAFLEAPGDYFTSLAFDAGGEFLSSLSGPWEELGINICSPRIPEVGFAIALGIAQGIQRPVPKCDFARTVQNWQTVVRQAKNPQQVLSKLSLSFNPEQSDLGQAYRAQEAFRIRREAKQLAAFTERIEGGGILPQKGIISGRVTTPAEVQRQNFQNLAKTGIGSSQPPTALEVANAVGGGEVWVAAGTTVLSTFVNTLLTRVLKLGLEGLFKDGPVPERPDLTQLVGAQGGATQGGQGARLSGSAIGLLATSIRTSPSFDIISQLAACPADRASAGQFSCTVDQQFMVAIQQASAGAPLTVKEAVERGYLDRGKPFGFTDPAGGREPDYTEGYPYSSMKKLRLLRIIPIGWEFAALAVKELEQAKTLGDVLDGYANHDEVTSGCQGTVSDPTESPFCGLVDPNWILKAPSVSCGATVFGAAIDGTGTGRKEVCADIRHCVAEDERGNCRATGYCTREKNVWRFDGDACDAQYASCDTFKPAKGGGAEASLLETTLDFGACNGENAGCTAYARNQVGGVWTDIVNPAAVGLNRIYLDGNAPSCNAASDGCTEFVSAPAPNLIKNPGFEKDDAAPTGFPDNWAGVTAAQWSSDATQSFEGRAALRPTSPASAIQIVPIQAGLTYTFSMYAKGGDASDPEDQAQAVIIVNDTAGAAVALADEDTTCAFASPAEMLLAFSPRSEAQGNPATYVRRSCSFQAPANAGNIVLKLNRAGNADVFVDALQLEAGRGATAYRDGYGASPAKVYYKAPPPYLGCTGEEGDPATCGNYSRICRPLEAGCERYTPKNGDPAVPGVVTALDRCPSECVGYNTYLKQASAFEPRFAGENPYLIIPSRSQACSAAFEGCDEFTNLKTERREYYSALRACQPPSADSTTYFTWEGSDTTGYQLKTWSLKQSNFDVAQTGVSFDVDTYNTSAPSIRPPCTNYSLEYAGGVLSVSCTDGEGNQATCLPDDPSLTSSQRADCRSFYDSQGNIFRRSFSRTIVSTEECRAYRWSGLTVLPEVTRDPSAPTRAGLEQEACDAGKGKWDGATSQCLYLGAPSLSRGCLASFAGCRGYRGNTGSNTEVVLSDGFEAGIALWSGASAATASSSEALTVGGHSLRVSDAGDTEGASYDLSPEGGSARVALGSTYVLSFLAKGSDGAVLRAEFDYGAGSTRLGDATLTTQWQPFSLGPVTLSGASLENPTLAFKHTGTGVIAFYLDDIVLKRVSDIVYLVKNSWDIPDSCDTLPPEVGGGHLRGATVGCQEYRDRAGDTHTIKSFSSLCRDQSVGCQDLIDTAGSDSPFAENFNTSNSGVCRGLPGICALALTSAHTLSSCSSVSGEWSSAQQRCSIEVCNIATGRTSCNYGGNTPACPPPPATPALDQECSFRNNLKIDDLTVPDDAHRFVVADKKFACQASAKGCQALGKPDGEGFYTTTYLKNDPNRYGETLCGFESEGCQSWKRKDQSLAYFKDPGGLGCEWRKGVKIGDTTYSGWFRKAMQAVSLQSPFVDTKEECSGYGAWDSSANLCVDANGATVIGSDGVANHCGAWGPCNQELCGSGAGGTWQTNPDGGGTCLSDAPCYGAVRAIGSETGPHLSVTIGPATYLTGGTNFGIWRNFDSLYAGRTGACPPAQAGCTEFLDPTDTSSSEAGASYYFLDNERLQSARAACKGTVSRKEGCVLFDQTDNPVKSWAAIQSYALSDSKNGALTAPVSVPGTPPRNNVNTIVKVLRDRECGQWLACQSAQWVWQPDQSRFKAVCTKLGRCDEIAGVAQGDNIAQCSNWIPVPLLDDTEEVNSSEECGTVGGVWNVTAARCQLGRLTRKTYQARDRRFQGREYTGYSITDLYPAEKLTEVNFGSFDTPNPKLAYPVTPGATCSSATCTGGTCTNGQCVQKPNGGAFGSTPLAWRPDCRGFPERNAPFPNTEHTRASQAFQNAPRCISSQGASASSTDILSCGCNYTKSVYSAQNRYDNEDVSDTPAAVCFGGSQDGKTCGTDGAVDADECQQGGGTCSGKTKQIHAVGWQGYCLETDPSTIINADPAQSSRACLTWWPIDVLPSAPDVYNQFAEAGYQIPEVGGQYWCLNASDTKEPVIANLRVVPEEDTSRVFSVRTIAVADQGIYKNDIKAVVVTIEDGDENRDSGEATLNGPMEGAYILEPAKQYNQTHLEGTRFYCLGTEDDCTPECGICVPGTPGLTNNWYQYNFSDADAQWWWWAGDDNDNRRTDSSRSGVPNLSDIATVMTNSYFPLSAVYQINATRTDVGGFGNYNNGEDAAAVLLRFDPATKLLTHVRFGTYNDDAGLSPIRAVVRIRLHPQCTAIARVDPSRSAPRTNNLWQGNPLPTPITHESGFSYTVNTPFLPFGSSPSHDRPPLSGTTRPWFLNLNRMEQGRTFSGWPYACLTASLGTLFVNDSGFRCTGGTEDGNECVPTFQTTSTACIAGGGACASLAAESPCVGGTQDGRTCVAFSSLSECQAGGGLCIDTFKRCSVNASTEFAEERSVTDGVSYPIIDGDPNGIAPAVEDFDNLFARSYRVYTWSPASPTIGNVGRYIENATPPPPSGSPEELFIARPQGRWDDRSTGQPVQVRPVGVPNSPASLPVIDDLSSITVNDEYAEGSVVAGQDGFLPATIKFFATADNNQMPLRQITVDWDDGTQTVSNGLYRNHLGTSPSAWSCNESGFGRQGGVTCDTAYFTYSTVYSCVKDVGPNWQAEDACPVADFSDQFGGCCVFRPKVQVRDNWGFCNGACAGTGPGITAAGACFDDACNVPFGSLTSTGPWTPFAGQVIVAPRE